jgi:hypothetical protein
MTAKRFVDRGFWFGVIPKLECIRSYRINEPEALKRLYRSPGYKKKQLVLCKNYVVLPTSIFIFNKFVDGAQPEVAGEIAICRQLYIAIS